MKHLTGADTTFLYTETPTARLEVATCMVLDGRGQPRGDALLRQVRDLLVPRLHLAPLLRRRLVHVPLELDNPVWVEDPGFDVDAHLHRRRLPRPGTMAQLGDAVGEIMAVPLDRSRPLWDLHVIEGLAGGKVAIVVKTHHAAVDGVAGFELLSAFVDLEPGADAGAVGEPERPWAPEPVPARWSSPWARPRGWRRSRSARRWPCSGRSRPWCAPGCTTSALRPWSASPPLQPRRSTATCRTAGSCGSATSTSTR